MLELQKSVSVLNSEKYDAVVFEKSYVIESGISDDKQLWICHSCDKFLKKKKIPPKAQTNSLELNPKYQELEDLCPIELTLISQIIPFMTNYRNQDYSCSRNTGCSNAKFY